MDFSLTSVQRDLQERTRQFIADQVMPMERDSRQTLHGPAEDLRAELVEKARAAGLLTPHASTEAGG
ncbi:MAG: acyl-CoA dehydrogenase family protein, partial [Pseudonocardiaceae bacterium]